MFRSRFANNDGYLLKMENIEKRYHGKTVLQIDDFTLRMGDLTLIHGESGSGKSTFLKLLAGVSAANKGRIKTSRELRRLSVAYIPQEGGLYSQLTLWENMQIRARLHGRTLGTAVRDAWYIEELGLGDFLDRTPGELSVGFHKMAVLACGLCVRPHALFIDEPLSGLDERCAAIIQKRLEKMQSTLRFLVMTFHEPREFPFLTKKVLLAKGKVQ